MGHDPVNLITVKPSQSFGGYITADYGNYDSKKLAGALNVPLSPTLAARAAFQIIDRDGYLSEGTDDSVQQAARLQLLWKPSGGVSLRLSGDYAHQGGRGAGAVLWPPQPGTRTRTSNTDPINSAVRSVSAFGIDTPLTPDSFLRNDLYNLAAELNVDLGDAATLTVIPAYRRGELTQRSYTIGSRFETPVSETDQTSLEVRLGNQSDRFKWVVGGFYFDLTGREVFKVNLSPFIPGYSVTTDLRKFSTKSVAAFGEVTVSLTDQLRGIAGLRYTKEDKAIAGFYTDTSVVQAFNAVVDSKRSFNAVTWKFGAEYDVSPTSMLFATVAKGFKSGGFFLAPPPDNQFDAELLTDFSIGSRNRFFDNKLQVNASVFYWKYRDQQVSSVGFTNSFFVTFLTRNAGASNPYGADLDVVFRATPNDTLSASLAYIKAEYDKYDVNYPAFLPTPPTACKVNAPAGGLTPIDCSGFPLARTPEWSGSASYRHEFDFSDGSTVDANLGMTFASSRFLSVDFFTPDTKTGGYALVNADVTYHTPDKAFSVTAYMRNIGNKTVYVGSQTDLFGNGLSHRTLGAPRTYGISANYKF